MKKETLLEIILGTIGGLVFAIGMCMCLIPEWNLLATGIIVAIIGFIILLCNKFIRVIMYGQQYTCKKLQTDICIWNSCTNSNNDK